MLTGWSLTATSQPKGHHISDKGKGRFDKGQKDGKGDKPRVKASASREKRVDESGRERDAMHLLCQEGERDCRNSYARRAEATRPRDQFQVETTSTKSPSAGYTRLARIRRKRLESSMLIRSSLTAEQHARHVHPSSAGNTCRIVTKSTTSSGKRSHETAREQGHSIDEHFLEVPSKKPHDGVVQVGALTVSGNASDKLDVAVNNNRNSVSSPSLVSVTRAERTHRRRNITTICIRHQAAVLHRRSRARYR